MHYIKQSYVLILFILLLGINPLKAQFSRTQAINLVIQDILLNETNTINIYASAQIVSNSISKLDQEVINCPYNQNWVFIIDPFPSNTDYYQYCQYIFINAQNGEYSIENTKSFPTNHLNTYQIVSEAPNNTAISLPASSIPIVNATPNEHLYAIITCSYDFVSNWNSVSLIYNTLMQKYGYKKENIYVFYGDGTGIRGNDLDGPDTESDDIDYPNTWPLVSNTLNEMAGITNNSNIPKLDNEDQLSVFFTGSAAPADWVFNEDSVNPNDISEKLSNIDCAQMNILVDQLYTGGTSYQLFFGALYM